jgi:outer membrane protein
MLLKGKMMKKPVIAVLLATLGMAGQAMAESPLMVRVRAVHINPADKSDAFNTPIGAIGADAIHVSDKTIPELDVSYLVTPNIAAELVLTYPQKHDVSVDGLGKIGTVKHLPPTLLAQYYFTPGAQFSPYVGAGVSWTTFSKNNMPTALGNVSLEHDSLGFALQAGVDYKIDKNWSLNLDIKKVQIRSDVLLNGNKLSTIKIDPLLVGFGVGYRF